MNISLRSFSTTYFKEVQVDNELRKEEIQLQYHITVPEYIAIECLLKHFKMFLNSKKELIVFKHLGTFQEYFEQRVIKWHRTCTYSGGELNLISVVQNIYRKSLMQVNFELDLLSDKTAKAAEQKIQQAIEEKVKQSGIVVLTQKQAHHLLSLYKSIREEDRGIPLNPSLYKISVYSI